MSLKAKGQGVPRRSYPQQEKGHSLDIEQTLSPSLPPLCPKFPKAASSWGAEAPHGWYLWHT